jgi:hypothetical protein
MYHVEWPSAKGINKKKSILIGYRYDGYQIFNYVLAIIFIDKIAASGLITADWLFRLYDSANHR